MAGLRDFLGFLESRGELVRISREVDPVFEASAVIKTVQDSINKAIVFENIKGFNHPLVSNIFGTHQRVADILGCESFEINATWNRKEKELEKFSLLDAEADADKYVECTISEIPALTYREKDAGPYLTAGVVLAKDAETGKNNLSFHRMQIVDNTKLRIRITPGNHLGVLYEKVKNQGKPLEVAVLLGGHPAFMLAAASRLPLDQDEVKLAATLLGNSVKMRKCDTISLNVPCGIDYVIEGVVLPDVREEEGPFGEFLGYYVPVNKNLVLEVRRVSRLTESCAYGILAGSAEQDVLAGVPVAANIYKVVQGAIPSVVDVSCLPSLYHSVVKIKQQFSGQARQVALAALACEPSYSKICTVVDEDVNIYDPIDVEWAMITRCCPAKDIVMLPGIPSLRADLHGDKFMSKMGIDATKPVTAEEAKMFERARVPGIENINLNDYLNQ